MTDAASSRIDLKFRLEVTIIDGVLSSAELTVRDGQTRESRSLGGWPVPSPGATVARLLWAIEREIERRREGAPG